MYLPTKGVRPDECLLAIGANILDLLSSPLDSARIWDDYQRRAKQKKWRTINFDWFCLALASLHAAHLVELDEHGMLRLSDVS